MNPAGDLIFIIVSEQPVQPFQIAEGDPILGAGAIEDLKVIDNAQLDALLDPPQKPDGTGPKPGMTNDEIRLQVKGTGLMAINDVLGELEDSGDDYKEVAHLGSSRYAKTGAVLELTVRNCSGDSNCISGGQNHPFHLHGFSFQPYQIIDNASGNILYEYDYNEFLDVIDVFKGQSVVFRTRLDDREIITDNRQEADAPPPNMFYPGGGAQGRWVFHCHLFLHASLGMISELVVVPTPVAVCNDVTVDTAPGFCAAGPLSIDGGTFHPDGEFFSLLQDPSSGVFDLGDTMASLTATGADGLSTTCEATVTVVDNEVPTISAPADVTAECTDIGGRDDVALGSPVTDDNCGQNFTQSFPPSFFPLGNTTVKWQTSDGNGNSAIANQLVTVRDTKKPSLTVPADVGPIECTGPSGEFIDIGQATATDACDDTVMISDDAPAQFPLGTTVVHWTGRDDSSNTASGSQSVTVGDSSAPIISCNSPAKIAPAQIVLSFTATAADTCDTDVIPEAFEYDCYSFTKKGKRVDRSDRCDVAFRGEVVDIINSGGVGDMIEWTLLAVDDSGNSSTQTCIVNVVRKKDL
jgi:hypothetical protein